MSAIVPKKHRILEDRIKIRRFFKAIFDIQTSFFDSDSTNIWRVREAEFETSENANRNLCT